MGNWSEKQEERKETKERDRTRREKLAGYFFDLSKLSFAGLVIGGIVSINPEMETFLNVYRVIIGGLSTAVLAFIGNKFLK